MKRLLLVLAAVAAVLVPATPALAHNQLVSAEPARDATLRRTPAKVTLAFLQRLDPEFTTVVVSDADKRPVPMSEPAVKAKTAAVRFDEPLVNGRYTVAYRVVSVDGHTVQGSYAFTVADPSPASATPSAVASEAGPAAVPSASAPVAAASVVSPTVGVSTGVLVGLGLAGVVLLAGAVLLYLSRRRRAAARP